MVSTRFLGLCALALIGASGFGQRTLTISAPVGLSKPLALIATEYEKIKPGVDVRIVAEGRAADVSVREVRDLPRSARQPRAFVQDRLMVVVRKDEERVTKFAHVGLSLSLAIAESDSVKNTLESASTSYGKDWDANLKRNIKNRTSTGEEAVRLVVTDKADAAIVHQSALKAHEQEVKAIPIPLEMADTIEYAAYSTRAINSLSAAFIEFIFSAGNQLRLESFGFTSPLRAPQELVVQKPNSMLRLFSAAIPTLKKETITVTQGGRQTKLTGASLRSVLEHDSGTVTFIGADRQRLSVPVATIRRSGGILYPMAGGNFRVILPSHPESSWIRWLRRIEVK